MIRGWSTHITVRTTGLAIVSIVWLRRRIRVSDMDIAMRRMDVLRWMVGFVSGIRWRGVVSWIVGWVRTVSVGIDGGCIRRWREIVRLREVA